MDTSAIFQRTDIGRDTIKTKAVKLTQSERLLLIIIDGATPYGVLRKEVWALSEERFDRALRTLLKEGLIFEVLLPLADQIAEELDSAVVDLFLQQDPLDPVTIISFDPEDEFGLEDNPKPSPGNAPTPAPMVFAAPPAQNVVPEAITVVENTEPTPAYDTIPKLSSSVPVQPLAELIDEDQDLTPPSLFQTPAPALAQPVAMQSAGATDDFPENWPEHLMQEPAPAVAERIHWAYWLALISGIAMLLVALVANLR